METLQHFSDTTGGLTATIYLLIHSLFAPVSFIFLIKKSSILFVYCLLFNSLLLPYVMVNKDYQNLRFAIAHESKK